MSTYPWFALIPIAFSDAVSPLWFQWQFGLGWPDARLWWCTWFGWCGFLIGTQQYRLWATYVDAVSINLCDTYKTTKHWRVHTSSLSSTLSLSLFSITLNQKTVCGLPNTFHFSFDKIQFNGFIDIWFILHQWYGHALMTVLIFFQLFI